VHNPFWEFPLLANNGEKTQQAIFFAENRKFRQENQKI
jgi:hypothetical protein